MRPKSRHIILACGVILIGIIASVTYFGLFFNPFEFGPCDGNGKPDRYEKIYYDNGQIEMEGQLKDCSWHGLIKTYYETGEIKSEEQRFKGVNHGESNFYYPNGNIYKEEEYRDGELISFKIYSLASSLQYEYIKESKLLSKKDSNNNAQIAFTDSLNLIGNDNPFTMLHGNNLIIRGEKDFYVINPSLEIKMDLRDTLMKYIPTAYLKKKDESGNIYDFLWDRRIETDSLKLTVYYEGNEHQSMYKTWERNYKLE